MKLQKALFAGMAIVLGTFSLAQGATQLEETIVVKVPRGTYGPRGSMGDFVMLKDGTLMMSFTKDVSNASRT
jgi:hypothetical protein